MTTVPVYLFTGFLGAGKTTFIQSALEDASFKDNARTLLLLCEDGEEEYYPERFNSGYVFTEVIEAPSQFSEERLERLLKEHKCTQVMVEYNGMWLLDAFYAALPRNWMVAQEFFFADAGTIMLYNSNMRNLVGDKLKSCELAVFNRFPKDADIMPYHKLVRGLSRSSDIAYEHDDGTVEYDDIVDPLPFDVNAPVIEVDEDSYAIWYRDLSEEMDKYDGKTVRVLGQLQQRQGMDADELLFGRQVMTCCVDDTQFAGLICRHKEAYSLPLGWVTLTASIKIQSHIAYNRVGPVLTAIGVEPAEPPAQEVATFY